MRKPRVCSSDERGGRKEDEQCVGCERSTKREISARASIGSEEENEEGALDSDDFYHEYEGVDDDEYMPISRRRSCVAMNQLGLQS